MDRWTRKICQHQKEVEERERGREGTGREGGEGKWAQNNNLWVGRRALQATYGHFSRREGRKNESASEAEADATNQPTNAATRQKGERARGNATSINR